MILEDIAASNMRVSDMSDRFGELWGNSLTFDVHPVPNVEQGDLFRDKPALGADEKKVYAPWIFRQIVDLALRENVLGDLKPSGVAFKNVWSIKETDFATDLDYNTHEGVSVSR